MKWWSNITGGKCNVVPRIYSVIGGGTFNCITSSPNTASCYSFIGGGSCNVVSVGCSAILGGVGNTASGSYSAILGGSGNTVSAAYNYAAVFGQNVAAVASNTVHVECLNACAAPSILPGYPTGTLMYITATAGMVAAGFPVGSRIAMIAP